MQVNESVKLYSLKENTEHVTIRRRLVTKFAYYNTEWAGWRSITNFADPECEEGHIEVRCKYARQTLQLPYPFRLTSEVCYLWGLIAASAHQRKQLEIVVDANQEPILQRLAAHLGIQLQITPIQRVRRKRGSKRPPSWYRKIQVRFPFVFTKFLTCLGYQQDAPSIPQWLSPEQRLAWFEGYLSSPKIQCRIRKSTGISPQLSISIARNNSILRQHIEEILDLLDISYTTYHYQTRFQVIIQNKASLNILHDTFTLHRPKVQILMAILQESERNPALRTSLQKLNLSEFQLTLYGLALIQPLEELEYTLFERTFASSSSEIRYNLYLLDRMGLIAYYKKENNKEFLIRTTRYLHHVDQLLRQEKEELRRHLKLSDSNSLSFHCQQCQGIVSYLEAMEERTFQCPHCHSRHLEPLEVSQYFYYGHLGHLTYQHQLIQGAMV